MSVSELQADPKDESATDSERQRGTWGFTPVPLAWQNLTHSPRRLAASVAGVTFAVLVMFVQVGFLFGLLDSATAPIRLLAGDVVIVARLRTTLVIPERFARRRLQQAAAVPGVDAVRPLYINVKAILRDPETRTQHPLSGLGLGTSGLPVSHKVRVLAVEPDHSALTLPPPQERDEAPVSALTRPMSILFDRFGKPQYFGHPEINRTVELGGKTVTLIGLTRLGTDFANDANVIVSDRTFAKLFPFLSGPDGLPTVDLGVVEVAPGIDPVTVRDRLRAALPADEVNVLTRAEYAAQERKFWLRSTPVGFIFGLGTMVGFLVGTIICYQILFSEVTDHAAEFATVKAMGYGRVYLAKVILQEAVLLSIFGFLVGTLGAYTLYSWLSALTGLQMSITLGRAALVGGLTVLMCVFSGIVTVRRVFTLDPAELF